MQIALKSNKLNQEPVTWNFLESLLFLFLVVIFLDCLSWEQHLSLSIVASHADFLRGLSRVPPPLTYAESWNEKPLPFVDYGPIRGRFPVLGKLVFCMAFFRSMWLAMHNTIRQCWLVSSKRGLTTVERKWFLVSAEGHGGGTRDEALRTSAWEATCIAKILLTSPIVINVPTRASLAVRPKGEAMIFAVMNAIFTIA